MNPSSRAGTGGTAGGPSASAPQNPTPAPVGLPACLVAASERVCSEIDKFLAERDLPGIGPGLRHQLESGGKRLRPAMTLWLLERRGGDPETGVPFALAVELLHNYLLIHDDIEDGDRVRRDRPTLWVHLGVPTALNVADYMIAEAYRALATAPFTDAVRVSLVELYSRALATTVEGQALDLLGRADGELTLERYEEIIRKKTGRYLAFAWVGAARMAGDSPADDAPLWRVGDHLGSSFQMRDDLIDLTDGKGRGGELGCDIREGKPSFLVAYTLASPDLSAGDRSQLVDILQLPREQTEQAHVQWVAELFRRSGALEACARESRQRAERAVEDFSRLPGVDSRTVAEFREIAEYVAGRKV